MAPGYGMDQYYARGCGFAFVRESRPAAFLSALDVGTFVVHPDPTTAQAPYQAA